MKYLDSSRLALDHTCPRARWFGYHAEGQGLEPIADNPDLSLGRMLAESVEWFRQGGQGMAPDLSLVDTQAQTLIQGWLTAYEHHIWPTWQQDFELLHTELECQIDLTSDIRYMARPDAVLKRNSDGTIWVLSDKTSSLSGDQFVRMWDKAVQNHAECVCVEQTLGCTVSGYFVQGWLKGYEKAGSRYSPLCNAYCKRVQPGMGKDQWQAEYKWGWERRLVSEYPGGVGAWVSTLSDTLIKSQFPVAGPLMLDRRLVDEYFEDAVRGELRQDIKDFPRRFQHCDEFGKYRRPCAFKDVCWGPTIARDPIGSGLYRARVPNHPQEGLDG